MLEIRNIGTREAPPCSFDELLAIARSHQSLPGCAVFTTSGFLGRAYVFLEPVVSLCCADSHSFAATKQGFVRKTPSPWPLLETYLDPCFLSDRPPVPVAAGGLSYEFLHHIENVPRLPALPLKPPDASWHLYRRVLEWNPRAPLRIHTVDFDGDPEPFWIASETPEAPSSRLHIEPLPSDADILALLDAHSTLSNEGYLRGVRNVREAILCGDVYQVNLTRRAILRCTESPWELFAALQRTDPAPFAAFYRPANPDGVSNLAYVSASPERFFSCQDTRISCAPIKGTRPRHSCGGTDAILREELGRSEKDRAELSMIVDLMRNDLSRVCEVGSVEVPVHAEVTSHPHVHHLHSEIIGRLRAGIAFSDIVRATFPSGSITGTPKIAAMKHIAAVEGASRGIYTGSIGFLGPGRLATLNVAIRTALVGDGLSIFGTGGGIVIDSSAAAELEECAHKIRGMVRALTSIGVPLQ